MTGLSDSVAVGYRSAVAFVKAGRYGADSRPMPGLLGRSTPRIR